MLLGKTCSCVKTVFTQDGRSTCISDFQMCSTQSPLRDSGTPPVYDRKLGKSKLAEKKNCERYTEDDSDDDRMVICDKDDDDDCDDEGKYIM